MARNMTHTLAGGLKRILVMVWQLSARVLHELCLILSYEHQDILSLSRKLSGSPQRPEGGSTPPIYLKS